MRVKVCGVKTEEDIEAIIKADVDAVGFLVGQMHTSNDFILPSTAGRLAKLLPPYIVPVIVTHLTDPDEIIEIVGKSGITTVQLHGGSSVEEVKSLCNLMPLNSKLILAAHVEGNAWIPELEEYYPFIDAIVIDSLNAAKGQVGGTGQIHNWNVSAELVQKTPLPVILAGGLTPENVTEAINKVTPFAVDANSGTKLLNNNKETYCCVDKCTAFVHNAKHTTRSVN